MVIEINMFPQTNSSSITRELVRRGNSPSKTYSTRDSRVQPRNVNGNLRNHCIDFGKIVCQKIPSLWILGEGFGICPLLWLHLFFKEVKRLSEVSPRFLNKSVWEVDTPKVPVWEARPTQRSWVRGQTEGRHSKILDYPKWRGSQGAGLRLAQKEKVGRAPTRTELREPGEKERSGRGQRWMLMSVVFNSATAHVPPRLCEPGLHRMLSNWSLTGGEAWQCYSFADLAGTV